MHTFNPKTVPRLPASRFPDPAEFYFCDNCGRDLTKNLHHDRSPASQPLRPAWFVCQCGRQYLSGAAEWDNLTTWERRKRVRELGIGPVLFALLMIPGTLAYFARYGTTALLAALSVVLIPSILVARLLGFVLLDLFEIIASIWRTRVRARRASDQSMSRDSEIDQKKAEATQPVTAPGTIEHTAAQVQEFAGIDAPRLRPARNHAFLHKFRLSSAAAAVAVLVVATRWIPFDPRPTSRVSASSSLETTGVAQQESLLTPAKRPLLLMEQAATTERAMPKVPSRAFKRVQVGPYEIDDIAEDVTIRHFMPTLEPIRTGFAYKEQHIGADVTIRYFKISAN